MFKAWRLTSFAGARNVALNSAKSDLRCCLPIRYCFGCSVVAVMAVASIAVCSLSNRLSALAGVVLLTALLLLTAGVELIELSDFMIKSGDERVAAPLASLGDFNSATHSILRFYFC